ncbi:thioesterase family protein [Micromonospora sp. ATA32]|nr:thioesterase family protein [Micromonospora sp. ATA32]
MTPVALPTTATHVARPRYEGANIRTWIGFKHFMYLVEEAVLAWLREQGHGARELFHSYGLGVEIVDCSVQLPAVLEVDDQVRAEVTHVTGRRFTVQLAVRRDGRDVVVLRGKVTVALVAEADAMRHEAAPGPLAALVAWSLTDVTGPIEPRAELPTGRSSLLWSWRAPYFYCHFSDRVQHSGFVRCLEEVVDRFLADRGISVGRMLRERSWIPVVSRARVRLLAPAHMEETVHTVFTVTDVLRGIMFDGRMDCFVERDGAFWPVATASILHGYAISRGPRAGSLAELDPGVRGVLLGLD